MDISGTTVWTDHAVVGRIMQEHDALRDKLGWIHGTIENAKPSAEEVEGLLRDFQSMLEVHFVHEETYGFFQEITDKAPRLLDRARMLCEEHRRMLSDAAELCRFAAEECALLQEAHRRDLGLGN